MTRIIVTTLDLPCGEHDEDVPHEASGYVTLRDEQYDINIVRVVNLASGTVERGAGLSGRHAAMVEQALVDAFEREEAAERRAADVAANVRAVATSYLSAKWGAS